MWLKALLLGLAGAAGTLARYGLTGLVQRLFRTEFPWGTLTVNLVGCCLAGLLWAAAERRVPISGQTRTVILVGFMGAFTTFSSLMLETGNLLRDSQWAWAAGNVALNNVLGIAALLAGLAAGRHL